MCCLVNKILIQTIYAEMEMKMTFLKRGLEDYTE